MIMLIEFSFHYRLGKVLANISYSLTHVLALGHLSTRIAYSNQPVNGQFSNFYVKITKFY